MTKQSAISNPRIRNLETCLSHYPNLINPWYPSTAVGFEKGLITMVQLERGRAGTSSLRRAATVDLPEALIRPSFDEPNISDIPELSAALTELATSAGLLRQKRWSVALPDGSSRSLILALESQPAFQRRARRSAYVENGARLWRCT